MLSKNAPTIVVLLVVVGAAMLGACGGADGGANEQPANGVDDGTGGGGAGTGTAGGLNLGGHEEVSSLSIEPASPVIDAHGDAVDLKLTARFDTGSEATEVTWSTGNAVIGVFLPASPGTFRSKGLVAGTTEVTAIARGLTATTTVTVVVDISENAASLSDAERAALRAGGGNDGKLRWLYPYDGTVFPRGIEAPSLQLGSASVDATLLEITVGSFHYEGFFGPSAPVRIPLSQRIWDGLSWSAGSSQPVDVRATTIAAGQVTGPATQRWTIAQGSLQGAIYYNSYNSQLAAGGAAMRLRPGQQAEVLVSGGCTVCHSVSANGNVLAASYGWADGNPEESRAFTLAAEPLEEGEVGQGVVATELTSDPDGRKLSFAALTPNGERYLTNGVPGGVATIRGLTGPYESKLYDTATGAEIASPSFTSLVRYALTPSFSPDGTKIAFNHWNDAAETAGNRISVMDFDGSASPPLFSNLRTVITVSERVAAWPSFLPDGSALLFQAGSEFDTAGWGGTPYYGNIRLTRTDASGAAEPVALDALNGVAQGSCYLPHGEAEEANVNYEPTVLPMAVGGYYWVVFTSRRAYGNTIAPGGTVAGGGDKWGYADEQGEHPSPRKKLWMAAIDIDHEGKLDPSHPAFYLPGQELEAGNMRAFAALDACRALGAICQSGADCCEGFCRESTDVDEEGLPVTRCVPPPEEGCSHVDELCASASDCCDGELLCINGRCSLATPS